MNREAAWRSARAEAGDASAGSAEGGEREQAAAPVRVRVEAPARLHLGFLDPSGGLGRRFAGLGLTIDGFATVVAAEHAAEFAVEGPEADRVRAFAQRFAAAWQLPPARLRIERTIPAHAGLGSGTQLALATGAALARLAGSDPAPGDIARVAGRGLRSGIGVGAFASGGFLLDAGRGEGQAGPPPIVARLPFPAGWRLLLVLDTAARGLSGEAERRAFRELPPFPAEQAAHLCRLVLLRVLPGVATADFPAASRGIGEIQRILGAWYAPAQGGAAFTSRAVGRVAEWLAAEGLEGIGQSSWGPTGFALLPDPETAERLHVALVRRFGERFPSLRFVVVSGRNHGAAVATVPASRPG